MSVFDEFISLIDAFPTLIYPKLLSVAVAKMLCTDVVFLQYNNHYNL
jgi:hypothetical protein